ncbi:hypothetical protein HKX48_007903 [Thoreauomyces humboldtii]|nr:hypothetical protein HKX48_007903 [Thoreauomyces humboldtii]
MRHLGVEASHHINMVDMDAVFIEERGRFRYCPPSKYAERGTATDLERGIDGAKTKDAMLQEFSETIYMWLTQLIHFIHGMYAGLCLLTLILLPTFQSLYDADMSLSMSSTGFLAWYSPRAMAVSITFNVLSTFILLDAGDVVVGIGRGVATPPRARWWKADRRRMLLAACIVLFAFLSWISAVLILPIDDRLRESQERSGYGPYGDPDWFGTTSGASSALAVSDLKKWRALNGVRAVFGILSWLASRRARVKELCSLTPLVALSAEPLSTTTNSRL